MGIPSVTSSEIFEAIDIACSEWQLREIKKLLTKNHDAVWRLIEKHITPEAVRYVTKFASHNSPKIFMTYIRIIEVDIKRILSNQKQLKKSNESLEETLKKALQSNQISEELLETVFQYIELFCTKYPPQKIPNWDLSQRMDDDEIDPFIDNDPIWGYAIKQEDKEVQGKEINTLRQCMGAINHCVDSIRLITSLNNIKPEMRRLHIFRNKNIINTLNHIMVYLRQIADRSDTHTPYNELSKPGQPFGPDGHGFDCRMLVSKWEGLQGALRSIKNTKD